MNRAWRTALGFVLGLFARVYLATLRVTVHEAAELDRGSAEPWVLCFWHGQQVPLLCWVRRRTTVALVSHSRDGQLQTQILRWQGLAVARGSSSRGGARGLLHVVRALKSGCDAAFAVDGPKGPSETVAAGAQLSASRAGGIVVPMASYSPQGWMLRRSWDRLCFPRPFSRVYVRLGPPLAATSTREQLATALRRCSELAREDAGELRTAASMRSASAVTAARPDVAGHGVA